MLILLLLMVVMLVVLPCGALLVVSMTLFMILLYFDVFVGVGVFGGGCMVDVVGVVYDIIVF